VYVNFTAIFRQALEILEGYQGLTSQSISGALLSL